MAAARRPHPREPQAGNKNHGTPTNRQAKIGTVNRSSVIRSIVLVGIGALGLIGAGRLARSVLTVDEHESRTTDTKSTQLNTSAERVAFLSRYFKLRTPVNDAAFHIVFHDNSGGLPGPSDWSIAAVVKVTPADGPTWLAEARPLAASETMGMPLPATAGLIPGEWRVSSPGERYARDGALLVWHSEGVLEFAAATQ